LKGWTNFAGGLDIKSDTTGKESYFANHRGCEVMFHVSTMLPYYPKDEQQVERKRHIGNDVILIIFREGGSVPFKPQNIASQFNHVWTVVQPVDGSNMFRVAVANKFGVKPYEPTLPYPPIFESGPKLKEFILTKLINGERSSMYAPDFRQRMTKTRETHLKDIIETILSWKNQKLENQPRKRSSSGSKKMGLPLPTFMKEKDKKKKDSPESATHMGHVNTRRKADSIGPTVDIEHIQTRPGRTSSSPAKIAETHPVPEEEVK